MIQHAFERNQRDKDHRVEYQIADAMVFRFEPNAFDIVFSRDCIHHIQDTKTLFRNIYVCIFLNYFGMFHFQLDLAKAWRPNVGHNVWEGPWGVQPKMP